MDGSVGRGCSWKSQSTCLEVNKNGLAVGAELSWGKIKPGIFCTTCGREETAIHRFRACPHSQAFWTSLMEELGTEIALPPDHLRDHKDLVAWLLDWLAQAANDEKVVVIEAIYALWLSRNEVQDGKRIVDPREVARSAIFFHNEWRAAHDCAPVEKRQRQKERWLPPVEGWIKLNSDATFNRALATGEAGAILRDQSGTVNGAACAPLANVSSPEAAELKSC